MHPFDDLFRYHRPAALLYSAQFGKNGAQAYQSALKTLAPAPKPSARRTRAARVVRRNPE